MPSTPSISKATIFRITCVLWIVGKLICYKLWLADRLFPLVPVWDGLMGVPSWVHIGLYGLSLGLMGAVVVLPSRKGLQWMLLASEVASCLFDQNRWQPWEYQYLFTVFIMLVNKDNIAAIKAFAFLLAATYIYSGLNKFTHGFLGEIWDSLILRGFFKLPVLFIHKHVVYYAGYGLGMIELMSGIGLFFRQTRKPAAMVLIGMHLFVLLLLGPLGLRINMVVWPWNVAMCAYLYLVFIRGNTVAFDRQVMLYRFNNMVWVFWGVLPALCFVGLWDNYLSSNLYSGRQPIQMICISNAAAIPELKAYIEPDKRNICNGTMVISLNKWAYIELHVPPYPEYRVLGKIEAVFMRRYPQAGGRFINYRGAR